MTSRRIAVVRRFYELLAAEDYPALVNLLDQDVVWFGTSGGIDSHRVIRGTDAFIAYLEEVGEPWNRYEVAIERLTEVADKVLALLRETTHSSRGDLELETETAAVFRVPADRIAEVRGYMDRNEALRATGLDKPQG